MAQYYEDLGTCSALATNDAVSRCQEKAAASYWKAVRAYNDGQSAAEGLHAENVFEIQRQYESDFAHFHHCEDCHKRTRREPASDLSIEMEHDGTGPRLEKKITNRGERR